jgi:hypothetical protein
VPRYLLKGQTMRTQGNVQQLKQAIINAKVNAMYSGDERQIQELQEIYNLLLELSVVGEVTCEL